jgi:multiple sugar transport system ATP-binding protein
VQAEIGGHPVALPAARRNLAGRDCVLGIRPEHVQFGFEAAPGGIPVELGAVTPFNVRTVMLLRTDDATEFLASRPEDSRLDAERGHRRGWARIDFDKALYFDSASGARL